MTGMREAIGETEFEMQQILGYAPIEPDGSFKLTVPADTPIGLAVVDERAQGLQTHTNWIQVRPGERRTCDGCHSPRRGGAINSGAVVNATPAAHQDRAGGARQSGETMAGTRTRLDPTLLKLVDDMVFSDILGRHDQAGRHRAAVDGAQVHRQRQSGRRPRRRAAPVNGIVNYPTHIAPLWTRANRGANTCTGCHNDPDKLDLSASIVGHRPRSSPTRSCMLGDPLIDPVTGLPMTRIEEGVLVIVRGPALVDTMASEGDALGLARKSRLVRDHDRRSRCMAGAEARAAHPNPPATAPDHSKMLNAAEKRVLAEFIDLGGKYFNDPFDPAANVRTVERAEHGDFREGCPADPHARRAQRLATRPSAVACLIRRSGRTSATTASC